MNFAEQDALMRKKWPNERFAKDLGAWLPSFAVRSLGHHPLQCAIGLNPRRHNAIRIGNKIGVSVIESWDRFSQCYQASFDFLAKLKPRPGMMDANPWSHYLLSNVMSSLFLGRGLGDLMGIACLVYFTTQIEGANLGSVMSSKEPNSETARVLLHYSWPKLGDRVFSLSAADLQAELATIVVEHEGTSARVDNQYAALKERFPF